MVWFAYTEEGYAAEQDDQYCDISSTTIKTTDQDGNIINNQTNKIKNLVISRNICSTFV